MYEYMKCVECRRAPAWWSTRGSALCCASSRLPHASAPSWGAPPPTPSRALICSRSHAPRSRRPPLPLPSCARSGSPRGTLLSPPPPLRALRLWGCGFGCEHWAQHPLQNGAGERELRMGLQLPPDLFETIVDHLSRIAAPTLSFAPVHQVLFYFCILISFSHVYVCKSIIVCPIA